MKLAVSNIAWQPEEEELIAKELQKMGVKFVEIAPTKVWDDPRKVSVEQINEYLAFWAKYDIEVIAFQSMLFPRPDLKIFDSQENQKETLEYLNDYVLLAEKMGVEIMVFGSPKNRQRSNMPERDASSIAKTFFTQIANYAQDHNVRFCIEPNAPQYNCDFITTANEGIVFVQNINMPGIRLHLDTACMTLAGDDISKSINDATLMLSHFHISAPMLGPVEDNGEVRHDLAGEALRKIKYNGFVSIEMRPGEDGANIERVRTAVRTAKKYYI